MWDDPTGLPPEAPKPRVRRLTRIEAIALSLVAHLVVLLGIYFFPSLPTRHEDRVEHDQRLNVVFKLTKAEFDGDSGASGTPAAAASPAAESPAALRMPTQSSAPLQPPPAAEPVQPSTSGGADSDEPLDPEPSTSSEEGRTVAPGSGLRQALRDFDRRMTEQREPAVAGTGRSGAGGGASFVPDLGAVPPTGLGVGELVFESRDFDWRDYGKQIYIAIWRAWHNRLWATTNEFERWSHRTGQWYLRHAVRVRFVIGRSGAVSGIEIDDESGVPPLDLSATDALAEVILPPLPVEFPRDREVVHAQFLAEGEVQAMRPTLKRFKQAGWF